MNEYENGQEAKEYSVQNVSRRGTYELASQSLARPLLLRLKSISGSKG